MKSRVFLLIALLPLITLQAACASSKVDRAPSTLKRGHIVNVLKKIILAIMFLPISVNADHQIAKVLTIETVNIGIVKSSPSQLIVHAEGTVNTSGWTTSELAPWVYVQPPSDGILDIEFIASPPHGMALEVISPVSASVTGPLESWVKGVRVHSSNGSIEKLIDNNKNKSLFNWSRLSGNEGDSWPFSGGGTSIQSNTTTQSQSDISPLCKTYGMKCKKASDCCDSTHECSKVGSHSSKVCN